MQDVTCSSLRRVRGGQCKCWPVGCTDLQVAKVVSLLESMSQKLEEDQKADEEMKELGSRAV